jgi:hypothetical protein
MSASLVLSEGEVLKGSGMTEKEVVGRKRKKTQPQGK